VKNNRASGVPPLGPSAGRSTADRPLSPSRAALLEALRQHTGPARLPDLTEASGLHPNTVREHLDGLIRAGLATREQAPSHGRGRPAWLYRAAGADVAAAPEYAGLAAALASTIARTSDSPAHDAAIAGREWGEDLAAERGARDLGDPGAARHALVDMLDDLGFAPDPDARAHVVRLRECPLLDAARRHTEVVCAVHLGLARGILHSYGASDESAELEPFAEPGACVLRMGERP
jgi:predicted ArsR family transcriptional regulator